MNNHISERRIRNNKLRRRRQIRRNIFICLMTLVMITGFSTMFFSFKAKAQSRDEEISYKYYKSITVAAGDTMWDYAERYADTEFYDSYESYIKEVININHLDGDDIIYGQHIILPYYSNEFVG
ncbi:MAG: LysM peptidoglycan-binding domain-containing protein [Suilimivivens sp.]